MARNFHTQYYMSNDMTESTCKATWVIEHFSVQSRESISSATFKVGNSDWRWEISGGSKMCLWCVRSDTVRTKCDFWFLNDETKRSIGIIQLCTGQHASYDKLSGFKPYLSSDVLTLCFELTVYKPRKPTSCRSTEGQLTGSTIQEDLRQLKISSVSSDVVLVSYGGKKIHAHRLVLAMRSPVFRAMFANDMKEKRESEVNLQDTDAALVEEMLAFMYTDSAPNIKSMAADLILMADKYDLERLKSMCERELLSNFSVDTVLDVLRLADKLNLTDLADAAVRYINWNSSAVRKTDSWKAMVREEPQLLERIYCALREQMVNSLP
ncbi:speckle-type POZ protein-like [Ornithodoros turicata]|uniref:speckle-type POZ protein-like n=1 Tax=Ornithodoros turicata TaxID=34597 RepID=UPI003138B5B6